MVGIPAVESIVSTLPILRVIVLLVEVPVLFTGVFIKSPKLTVLRLFFVTTDLDETSDCVEMVALMADDIIWGGTALVPVDMARARQTNERGLMVSIVKQIR